MNIRKITIVFRSSQIRLTKDKHIGLNVPYIVTNTILKFLGRIYNKYDKVIGKNVIYITWTNKLGD